MHLSQFAFEEEICRLSEVITETIQSWETCFTHSKTTSTVTFCPCMNNLASACDSGVGSLF